MAVSVKSEREIELMRESGRILGEVHEKLKEFIRPGISTLEIDIEGEKLIRSYDCIPNFLHYNGFPGSVCVSINDEVVHGIPRKNRILKEGDILSVDVGAILDGYQSDACRTYMVGEVAPEVEALVRHTEKSFWIGLEYAKAGMRTGDIGYAIQDYCEGLGYGVVRELTGHGIGTTMHQDPDVPNYGRPGHGYKLKKGMAICIEPMITLGTREIELLGDQWTIVTQDGKPASHYENTILITDEGPYLTTYDYEEGF